MRPKGTGYVEPQRDGTFRGRLPTGERLHKHATAAAAGAELDAAIRALNALPCAGLTLRSHGERFLKARELAGIRGIHTDRSRWRTHVEASFLADLPLRSITRADVRKWLDEVLRSDASPPGKHAKTTVRKVSRQTVQNTLNLLRVAFRFATERELIGDNPARDVRLPRSQGRTHDPWTYLLPDEQAAILSCAAIAEPDRLLVAFALGTGLRQGELWNLELADVQGDRLVVRRGSKDKATKSGKLRRVPLFGVAKEALDAWLPLLEGRPNPHGLVWPLPSGARRPKGKAPKWWGAALEAAGIDPVKRHDGRSVRWHDLRHTCASSLVAGWWGRRWSLEEVRALLGHSSIVVTERYAHLADSALEVAARATDGPTMAPRVPEGERGQVRETAAVPPGRIERPAFGLGRRSQTEELRDLSTVCGAIVGRSVEALEEMARGGPHAWPKVREALVEINRMARQGIAKKRSGAA